MGQEARGKRPRQKEDTLQDGDVTVKEALAMLCLLGRGLGRAGRAARCRGARKCAGVYRQDVASWWNQRQNKVSREDYLVNNVE